ncbi:unnamed protein product [Coregonus sp. 'balchen']|nr:unnamed protein product [Coregonus sp. 'balchen']
MTHITTFCLPSPPLSSPPLPSHVTAALQIKSPFVSQEGGREGDRGAQPIQLLDGGGWILLPRDTSDDSALFGAGGWIVQSLIACRGERKKQKLKQTGTGVEWGEGILNSHTQAESGSGPAHPSQHGAPSLGWSLGSSGATPGLPGSLGGRSVRERDVHTRDPWGLQADRQPPRSSEQERERHWRLEGGAAEGEEADASPRLRSCSRLVMVPGAGMGTSPVVVMLVGPSAASLPPQRTGHWAPQPPRARPMPTSRHLLPSGVEAWLAGWLAGRQAASRNNRNSSSWFVGTVLNWGELLSSTARSSALGLVHGPDSTPRALQSLGLVHGPDSTPRALQSLGLVHGPDSTPRALQPLGLVHGPDSTPRALSLGLVHGPDSTPRALQSLGLVHGPDSTPRALQSLGLVHGPDSTPRALQSLGLVHGPDSTPRALQSLGLVHGPDSTPRALQSLGLVHGPDSTPRALQSLGLVHGPDSTPRALQSLGLVHGPDSTPRALEEDCTEGLDIGGDEEDCTEGLNIGGEEEDCTEGLNIVGDERRTAQRV